MNIQDYHGNTGLLLLTKRDKAPIEVLRVLLQRGADVNFKPTYTYNAFQNILINYENFEPYLELLIEHGAMIDENSNTQSREETNFVYKLYSERIILSFEKYQYLKKHGYDVATMQFTDLKTILHFECQRNDPDIALVKYLINSDSVNIQDKFGRTAFFYYCKRSPNNYSRGKIRYEVVELFIKGGLHLNLNLNFERGVPLIQLLYKRDIDFNIIRLLIQNKANINIYSKPQLRSPLHLLCISGDPSKEKLKYFIKNGSRVNSLDSDQNIPLFYLLENSNCSYSSILYLIKQGSNLHNVNKYNENIYHFLFNNDSELAFMEQLIRIVLKEKVDLNLKSCKGIYPINLLSDNHHISYKLIKLFSDHGCYLNVFDQFANNPLSLSCQNEKLSFNTIKFLIDQKLNVNSQNVDLQTPLHYICKNPNTSPRFIELLVKSGANIHVRDNKGVAPYQYIYHGNMELIPIIKIFMENGLDINDTNECLDNTSFFFDFCSSSYNRHYDNTLKFLIENGANTKDINHLGESFLHIICSSNGLSIPLIDYFVTKKIYFNLLSKQEKKSPLYCCCNVDYINFDVVHHFIKNGADIHLYQKESQTSPILTLFYNVYLDEDIPTLEFVKMLIKLNYDLNLKDTKNHTILFYLIKDLIFQIW
ncbi:ankyrin repeat protein [Anaeramoeba flamelloides]|uniref:Ankyrin repeat protein n=1 Tax=Anaeramoeba flamelloides TaxID=1746091 RepID=A0AAV7YIV2_9EUKA|nr:ankyrin repeat protein [Anaeramoeba flamelloides]